MAYPSTIDSPTTNVDNVDVIYAADVNNLQTAVVALETKVGVDSSAVTSSHDYKLSEVTDKAVGKTATQTLTNKTLTSPVVNVGSDATGDMYYRNAGVLTRIPVGTDNQIMKLNGTTPNWEAEATTVNASTTVAGVVEEATLAENEAGTATGATGARLFINPATMPSNFFGDGSDGDVTISGNTTLTRDMFYNNLTINTGITLTTANYRIFVKDTLTNNNATTGIVNNGNNASGVTAGVAVANGSLIGGGAGGAGGTNSTSYGGGGGSAAGTVWIFAKTIAVQGGIKAIGGNGANGNSAGGSAGNFAGAAGGASAKTLITAGSGGAGGAGSGGAGGAGGTRTQSTMSSHNLLAMSLYIDTVSFVGLTAGSGGGGGGYDNTGSVAGGGGGGQGGVILCVYKTLTSAGTLSVVGGTAGTAAGGGTNGTAGGSGATFSLQIV